MDKLQHDAILLVLKYVKLWLWHFLHSKWTKYCPVINHLDGSDPLRMSTENWKVILRFAISLFFHRVYTVCFCFLLKYFHTVLSYCMRLGIELILYWMQFHKNNGYRYYILCLSSYLAHNWAV